MKRWFVSSLIVAASATIAGCSGGGTQAAQEATGKAQEIQNEKRAEAREKAIQSHQAGRRGTTHRSR